MAKYISLDSSAAGLDSGDLIINAENILYVEADSGTSTKIFLNAGPAGGPIYAILKKSPIMGLLDSASDQMQCSRRKCPTYQRTSLFLRPYTLNTKCKRPT